MFIRTKTSLERTGKAKNMIRDYQFDRRQPGRVVRFGLVLVLSAGALHQKL